MTTSPSSESGSATEKGGLSDFLARVLGQLALSAWLPAALLTISLAVLVQFRVQHSMNVADAVKALSEGGLTVLALTLPVLVCATLLTQAFSFEAIRTLEGYWRRSGPPSWLRSCLIRWQANRKRRLHAKRIAASSSAFLKVRPVLLKTISPSVVNALECSAVEAAAPALSDDDAAVLASLKWWFKCDPRDMARVDSLLWAEKDYPSESRILPTRLGNVIRATEDKLHGAGDDMEGFAMRRREMVSQRVQIQHDQFRTRLDMYCILVFVAGIVAIAAPLILLVDVSAHSYGWVEVLVVTLAFGLLSLSSYHAAIASARGYVTVLQQMDASAGSP